MFYILSAIFLWSTLSIVIKVSGAPVRELIFFSCLVSVSITGLFFSNREYREEIPRGRALLPLLVIGPISLLNSFSFYYAYRNTTVANAVLTHYTAPILVAFLAPIFLKERLTMRIFLAVAVATSGLWVMLGVSAGRFLDLLVVGDTSTGGILGGLLSGFAYAVLIILYRIFAQNIHPLVMTFSQNIIIAALLAPFVVVQKEMLTSLWVFVVIGVVHSTIAPILYFRGMKEVTANRAAILGYLEPVCAILMGAFFLGEELRASSVIGGGMIFFSGYLTVRGTENIFS